MPISSFEKAALLPKIYKIQLAVLLFLVVLDQLVTPSVWHFSENLSYRKKEKLWYSPLSSVLLTKFKFGLSVSSVWSPGLIEKLTIMKWLCDFQKIGTESQVATFLTLLWTRSLNQKNLKWNCFDFDMLLINEFYIKKYILCWLNKIMLGNPCTNF